MPNIKRQVIRSLPPGVESIQKNKSDLRHQKEKRPYCKTMMFKFNYNIFLAAIMLYK